MSTTGTGCHVVEERRAGTPAAAPSPAVVTWLMDGDPSVRWQVLRDLSGRPGSDPRAHVGCQLLWEGAARHDGGLTFGRASREPETCITGMLVLLAAAFGVGGERIDRTVRWLLAQQLADGGWNCDTIRRGSTHGSFHTSITVLEALHAYRGRTFFLAHSLYRSHRTGAVVDPALVRFPSRRSGATTSCAAWSTSAPRARPSTLRVLAWWDASP